MLFLNHNIEKKTNSCYLNLSQYKKAIRLESIMKSYQQFFSCLEAKYFVHLRRFPASCPIQSRRERVNNSIFLEVSFCFFFLIFNTIF